MTNGSLSVNLPCHGIVSEWKLFCWMQEEQILIMLLDFIVSGIIIIVFQIAKKTFCKKIALNITFSWCSGNIESKVFYLQSDRSSFLVTTSLYWLNSQFVQSPVSAIDAHVQHHIGVVSICKHFFTFGTPLSCWHDFFSGATFFAAATF